MKRLAPVFAILAMCIPVASHALGLGNIAMNSALNQALDAEIELLSVQSGDLDSLVVRLGSEEDFQRVGADRAFYLTKIDFKVIKRPDGGAYVKLTSKDAVTEPFLDFVVEARWARGRILREFTVLVDPPVLSAEAPAPVQQAAVAPAPAPAAAPATTTRQAPIRARAELAPVSRQAGELVYGPVKYNDTLFEIANRMRPAGVTVNQMMTALVRNNPQAFYNGNVNQLKAGYVLRVDDASTLNALSVAEADAEVRRQRVEWEARKSGRPLPVQETAVAAAGRVTREGAAAPSSVSAADQARLKLVAPGSQGAGSGAGGEDVDQLRQDLLLAAEALDANRQETDELRSRLAEMEEQLEAMQRLIMLKDDEMLALQQQMGEAGLEVKTEAPAEAMTEAPAMPEAAMEEAAEASEEMASEEAAAPEATEMAEQAEAPAPEPEAAAPMPAPAAMEEPGLLDNPLVMYGGIGVLLLLIVAAVIQRKRKMQDGFEESILNVGKPGAEAATGATAEAMSAGGESSMVSDFAMSEMSGMSGIQADAAEVDPISEADVYLAYGRHQQAEDILKEALEATPDRHEIKLKLLEVYFAAKDRDSFEQGAQELHDALGDESDPIWAKTVTMGAQLCPGNELFGGTSAETLQEELAGGVEDNDEDLLDFDFDLDSTDMEAPAATETAEDTGLDFDLDAEMAATEAPAEEPVVAAAAEESSADNGLDFDVSSLDFNLDEGGAAEATETAEAGAEEEGGLDFDLEGLGSGTAESEAAAEEPALDMGDLSMEEPAAAESAETESLGDLGDELGDDAFGEVDEVGTKLDLAKAYVDMGDGDGARSILDEVLEEGDDAQKQQAQELLAQIG